MLPEPSSLGTQLQIHPGQLPRDSPSSEPASAALRGASRAFGKAPNSPTSILNTYSGTNGARAAAITAGSSKQSWNEHDKPLHAHRPAGGGHEDISPLTAAQRSMAREHMRKHMGPTSNSEAPGNNAPTVRSTPSSIAAVLASSNDSRGRQRTVSRDENSKSTPNPRREYHSSETLRTGTEPPVRPHVLEGENHSQNNLRAAKTTPKNLGVETDHVAPTASLIQLFERSGRESDNSAPHYTVPSPAILSPKPVRPMSLTNTPLTAALAAAQTLSSRRTSYQEANPHVHSDGSTYLSVTAQTLPVNRDLSRRRSQLALPPLNDLVVRTMSQEVKSTAPLAAMTVRREDTPSSQLAQKAPTIQTADNSSSKVSSVDTQKPELRRAISSVPSTNTASPPVISLSREGSHSNIKLSHQSPSVESSRNHDSPVLNISEQRLLPNRRSMTPLMTESSLADAIVASSLASSRAPSPYRLSTPPPSRRRSRSRHMFQHHHHNIQLNSRSPSPPKAMRHTMRKEHDSDEEADDSVLTRRKKKNHFLNKHPNKHQEGARKRWRDVVTERERKRYEGVWAANKGIHVSVNSLPIKTSQTYQLASPAAESVVLNLVVRDIWSRSRLGNEVLEEIWDLVDRRGLGLLDREEFVVGMWLIDQRLKGRKLPIKVSVSVWDSVRALSGIKIPKRKT